jgi:hypothetical protein
MYVTCLSLVFFIFIFLIFFVETLKSRRQHFLQRKEAETTEPGL